MTKDEALKLALEALEYMDVTAEHYVDNRIPEAAITAIKEALAQPEQAPWECVCGANLYIDEDGKPRSKAQPEPWEKFCDSNCVWTDHHPDCKLAQRKPLTDEEMFAIAKHVGFDAELMKLNHDRGMPSLAEQFARAIEAAHGIKGEA